MRILGVVGLLTARDHEVVRQGHTFGHDSAAVLIQDGAVCAAVEEERLSRVKHTNRAPFRAIRFCLEHAGITLDDVDAIATYMTEPVARRFLSRDGRSRSPRTLLREALEREFGASVPEDRFHFVDHHICHSWSAAACAGAAPLLVMTFDGSDGNGSSGTVCRFDGQRIQELRRFSDPSQGATQSLGNMYLAVIRYLGYQLFDEYKVMGLAPYGDPSRYRACLQPAITLQDDGQYEIRLDDELVERLATFPIRRRGEPFRQEHKDLAAALQETLETVVFHVARHYAKTTGLSRLALAGGIAHNCTLSGKLLMSNLFEDVFVQPASHDAGCAIGAALCVGQSLGDSPRPARLSSIYWGPDIAGAEERILSQWRPFVAWERTSDISHRAATLLAEGGVIGWVQGRSEFGPRALGNRSILADPRPAANKDRINHMVKKREGYRPFAPSVLEEALHEYFDVPSHVDAIPFMTFVVPVREEQRARLAAVTHVDGTARVQTVSRDSNPAYWSLLRAFEAQTGVGVLLNTSLNNNSEPIVDSVEDAMVSYLTTSIDVMAIGDYWVTRQPGWRDRIGTLRLTLPRHCRLTSKRYFDGERWRDQWSVEDLIRKSERIVTREVFAVLAAADGEKTIDEAAGAAAVVEASRPSVIAELFELWSERVVRLSPQRSVECLEPEAMAMAV